jgi:hypothetical protein
LNDAVSLTHTERADMTSLTVAFIGITLPVALYLFSFLAIGQEMQGRWSGSGGLKVSSGAMWSSGVAPVGARAAGGEGHGTMCPPPLPAQHCPLCDRYEGTAITRERQMR